MYLFRLFDKVYQECQVIRATGNHPAMGVIAMSKIAHHSLQLVQVIINITHLSGCGSDLEKYLSSLTRCAHLWYNNSTRVIYYHIILIYRSKEVFVVSLLGIFLYRTDSEDGQVSRLYGLSTFKVGRHCLITCNDQFATGCPARGWGVITE